MLRVTAEAIEVHERFESEPGVWHTGRVVRHSRQPPLRPAG
jgi:hypothetical protein